jgi:hypothetical protein
VSAVKRWSDEFAIGRVFELRSTAVNREAPCVLVTGDPGYGQHSGCQIDGRGARHLWNDGKYCRGEGGAYTARSVNCWNFSPSHMKGGRIVRRRPDLERFNEVDIGLIQYGHDLSFGRRIGGSPYMVSLPLLTGVVWTIFTADNWYGRAAGWVEMKAAESLLHGDYYRHGFGDRQREAWFTMCADAPRLDEFEARYRGIIGNLTRTTVEIVEQTDDRGRIHTFGVGDSGPVIRSGGRRVFDPSNKCASYWSTS